MEQSLVDLCFRILLNISSVHSYNYSKFRAKLELDFGRNIEEVKEAALNKWK